MMVELTNIATGRTEKATEEEADKVRNDRFLTKKYRFKKLPKATVNKPSAKKSDTSK